MDQGDKTCELLIKHYQTYPELQIQDIFKFLYQSAFGCEHLVSSLKAATDYISSEYDSVGYKQEVTIEPLDGSYSRVSLSYMNYGLNADTFGQLFVASAKHEEKGQSMLQRKLKIANKLVCEGLLPFTEKDFAEAVAGWESEGYPPIHHSDAFRKEYCPSYRVIANEYIPFFPLFAEIDKRIKKGKVIVAVEGGSASGKTTLGKLLEEFYRCTVFHMDDFFLRPEQRTAERFAEVGGNIDRERFLSEVSQPLRRGDNINFRKFDCSTMSLSEEKHVSPENLVIVEGAYSMHPDLEKYYDFSVFLDISPQLQRERILHRNSPQMAQRFFDEWILQENKYFADTHIEHRCTMRIHIL